MFARVFLRSTLLLARPRAPAVRPVARLIATKPHLRMTSMPPPAAPPPGQMVKKKSLWVRVKAEAVHYLHGTKLLAKEIKIATRLLWKLTKGVRLTRREHTQLIRTAKDVFRLIPFAFFVIVPFMELLLPVALKLFPNMLPSTYSDQEKEEAKRRQMMESKLQMAKFLRDSIAESTILTSQAINGKPEQLHEFITFFKKYRTSGEQAQTDEVLRICKKFSDDLTLDNLSRPQLVTLCRFMGVNAFGTDAFLRYILRQKMLDVKNDDNMIDREGIDSLTIPELVTACQARGIRTDAVSPVRLRLELQQWLDIHLRHNVPPSLLILSRAFMMTDVAPRQADTAQALQTTLTSLPDEVVEEAALRLSEAEGKVSFKKKLDIIQKEEERIADELAEAEKVETEPEIVPDELREKPLADAAKPLEDHADTLSNVELKELGEALAVLSDNKNVDKERLELTELKLDREKLVEENEAVLTSTKRKQFKELDDLIHEIDEYLKQMDTAPTSHLKIRSDWQGNITTDDLEVALKMLRHPPDEARIKKIVKQLDADGDGRIFLKELLALADEVGDSDGRGVIKK